MKPQRVFISVADPSADANAALLAVELRSLRRSLRLTGLGGPAMRRAGVELLQDTVANAAMGAAAVLRALEVSKLLARLSADFDRDRPALVIAIDSYALNIHIARLAKARGVPVLYYVAPQTWASREGRVKQLRRVVDRLCCILPFEEPYFRNHGLDAVYVGHPLWDRLPEGIADCGSRIADLKTLSRRPSDDPHSPPPSAIRNPQPATSHPTSDIPHPTSPAPTLAVLPGSRKSVARANWPRLLQVMARLRTDFPGIRFRVPLTPNSAPIVRAAALPADVVTADGDAAMDDLLPGCDLALCVSGTAALHVAAHNVPLIVVYHGNPILWHLLGRWIVRTRTYSLVNLLNSEGGRTLTHDAHVAPEYIPWYGSTEHVATHAARLLRDPDALARMRADLARVLAPLSRPGATHRVAEEALRLLK